MQHPKAIQTFTEHHPFMGPMLWVASVQYYIVQIIVARAWFTPYSWQDHTISDLGNTVCGMYGDRYVCSPLYNWMNLSFVVLGITMILGSILLYAGFRKSRGQFIGFSFMGFAGLGTILVGLFPENSSQVLHALGAALPFVIGNLGLLVLGYALDLPKTLRIFTLLCGYISLVAFLLFLGDWYLEIGIGGMERIAVYPQTAWMIVFGAYVSANRMRE